MNRLEVAQLLTVVTSYDHRPPPGEADVIAWHGILGDLLAEECLRAVHAHYLAETSRIMPAHIRKRVTAEREKSRPAIDWGDDALIPRPDWFDERVQQAREAVRAENERRKERGEPPTFGDAIVRNIDRRPHPTSFRSAS